jgi:hypothetical protein
MVPSGGERKGADVPQRPFTYGATMIRFALIGLAGLAYKTAQAQPLPYPKPQRQQYAGSAVRARRCADDEARRHAAYGADASRRDTHASGEECAMPAWVHGQWRLLRALISHAAGSRPEAYALPKQIDAEGQ